MMGIKNRRIGNRLRVARKEASLLKDEAALIFGVAPRTVEAWESGENIPEKEKLTEIARRYGVSAEYLTEDYDLTATLTDGGVFKDGIRHFCDDETSDAVDPRNLWHEVYHNGQYDDRVGSVVSSCDGVILDLARKGQSGYLPYILKENPDANVIVGTPSTADAVAWKAFLDEELASPFVHYAVFDPCSMPFHDCSVDIISDRLCISELSDLTKALKEAYRVLKPCGELVSLVEYVSPSTIASLTEEAKNHLAESCSHLTYDRMDVYCDAGFESACDLPTVGRLLKQGSTPYKTVADELGTDLHFTRVIRFCKK